MIPARSDALPPERPPIIIDGEGAAAGCLGGEGVGGFGGGGVGALGGAGAGAAQNGGAALLSGVGEAAALGAALGAPPSDITSSSTVAPLSRRWSLCVAICSTRDARTLVGKSTPGRRLGLSTG